MTGAQLHDELRAWLDQVRRRWTRVAGLRAAARGSAAAAFILAAAVVIDRALRLEGLPLVLLMGAGLTLVAVAVAAAVRNMPRRPTDRQVARFVEERTRDLGVPDLNDSLVTAVEAAERPAASQSMFAGLILNDVIEKLRPIAASAVVAPREIRRQATYAAGAIAALLMAVAGSLSPFERAIDTARLQLFPGSVRLQVEPGDVRIPIGASVHIRASVKRAAGAVTRLAPTLTVFANNQRRDVPMISAAGGFEYVIESVDRTFSYDVSAGSARSARYTVTALRPPRVARIDLHYVYPSFAGLPPRDEQDGGDIYAPAGTRVRLRVHADKPIAQGELALGRSPRVSLQRTDDRTFEADLLLARDDSYRIRLADSDGLSSRDEAEYFIRLMDDRPPDVRILRPSADQQITPLEEVPIEARADDDYGIGRFELVYAVAGGAEHVVPFERLTGTAIQKIGTRVLPAEDLGVKPGDVITYYARATDVGRGKRSTEATSDIFFLEVKPFNEEFMAAESQAGSSASDPEIESLIQGQKEIISSTWNVERRSQAARSTEDVKAIAAAQAELKARAEQQLMSRTTRARGRSPAPEKAAQTAALPRSFGGDPVATAVGAMGKAVDQLTSERTKDALTHEMIALNGLLQLQAEVRRRQVSQSTTGSGNGGNRQGQDLSALFDKELQRQQRTNYETRSAAETRPDKADGSTSALDRIRDLAKRQEDLNRRQRELAEANLDPVEMKRQLEKLTREQIELREQTEELLRRVGSERDASQQKSQAGKRDGDLRGAADEMRSAASELRRDAPGEAARNGERAVDQLRRLERELSNDSQGTPAAAGSDVKLEAQQIAQEQHRIASEAARLDRNPDAATTADARRRLAGDKERLATRVDELRRTAERAGQAGPSEDAKAFAEAARTLQRDKIADRMRSTANEMRQGPGGRGSSAEQELARNLDQLAGKLGIDGSPLSTQLEQTRAIRDGLQRAEQQLRDAEARAREANRGDGSPTGESARSGRQGAGSGGADGEVQRLRQEYQGELQRAEDALRRLNGGNSSGLAGSTPEEQEFSRSAPGTEAFKQDRSNWESLRRNLDTALEKYEASVSDRLSRKESKDRFNAGGSDRVPDAYSQLISRYFESLAKKK
jgi:hypothetical protein